MWRKRIKWAGIGWLAGPVALGLVLNVAGSPSPVAQLAAWVGVGYWGYQRETRPSN